MEVDSVPMMRNAAFNLPLMPMIGGNKMRIVIDIETNSYITDMLVFVIKQFDKSRMVRLYVEKETNLSIWVDTQSEGKYENFSYEEFSVNEQDILINNKFIRVFISGTALIIEDKLNKVVLDIEPHYCFGYK